MSQAGNAQNQEDYERAYDHFFEELDTLEAKLSKQPFLQGQEEGPDDRILYDILVRWDTVYFFAYKLNRNRLADFPGLWRFAKALYHEGHSWKQKDMEAFKKDYYTRLSGLKNPYHLVPLGPDLSIWEESP